MECVYCVLAPHSDVHLAERKVQPLPPSLSLPSPLLLLDSSDPLIPYPLFPTISSLQPGPSPLLPPSLSPLSPPPLLLLPGTRCLPLPEGDEASRTLVPSWARARAICHERRQRRRAEGRSGWQSQTWAGAGRRKRVAVPSGAR
eukprot:746275-Hanusia_phi.AAC.1